jgi:rhomboid family GlyGly-CTERM serine protease
MNTMPQVTSARRPIPRAEGRVRDLWAELALFALLLVLCNLHLLHGGSSAALAFSPAHVAAGEWWRLFTHAFAHLSWYHLLLDGAAFLLLYANLDLPRRAARLGCLFSCATGSLLAALWCEPRIGELGLCGLSGVAHGLMACVSLQAVASPGISRAVAMTNALGLFGKSCLEGATGEAAFAQWHLGFVGTPIAVCHAGGVLGALVWMLAARASQQQLRRDAPASPQYVAQPCAP